MLGIREDNAVDGSLVGVGDFPESRVVETDERVVAAVGEAADECGDVDDRSIDAGDGLRLQIEFDRVAVAAEVEDVVTIGLTGDRAGEGARSQEFEGVLPCAADQVFDVHRLHGVHGRVGVVFDEQARVGVDGEGKIGRHR